MLRHFVEMLSCVKINIEEPNILKTYFSAVINFVISTILLLTEDGATDTFREKEKGGTLQAAVQEDQM